MDLASKWNQWWGLISSSLPSGFTTIMLIVGFGLIFVSLIVFGFKKARGKGGDLKLIWWSLAFGALLIAPNVIVPVLAGIFDVIITAITNLGGKVK